MSVLGDPIGACKRCGEPLHFKAPFGALLHPECDHRAWAAIRFGSPHAARWRKWQETNKATAANAMKLVIEILGGEEIPAENLDPPPKPRRSMRTSALADIPMRRCMVCGSLTPCRSSVTGKYLHPACASTGPSYMPPGCVVVATSIKPPFVGLVWPRVATEQVWHMLTRVLDAYPGDDAVYLRMASSGNYLDPRIKVTGAYGLSLEIHRVLGQGCTIR